MNRIAWTLALADAVEEQEPDNELTQHMAEGMELLVDEDAGYTDPDAWQCAATIHTWLAVRHPAIAPEWLDRWGRFVGLGYPLRPAGMDENMAGMVEKWDTDSTLS